MKKKFTILLSMLLMTGLVWDYNFQSAHTRSSGAPAGSTGSPGDGQSCASIGCHAGPTATNELIAVTSNIPNGGYVGGTTYDITVTMTKSGGQKFGFQLSPQDNAGNGIGSLISGGSTQIVGSKYITHKAGNTAASGGTLAWNFQWIAPTGGTGDVDMYVAGNFSNNQNNSSGDVIVTDVETVSEGNVGINDLDATNLTIYPNPVVDMINIAMKDVDEEIMVTLYGLDGRVVHQKVYTQNLIAVDVASMNLSSGVYLLNLEVAGNAMVRKLLIK
ncbi:MAG: T9SS type A sorting domain-containing protein [Flavobacteriales bacterium]|nr:T9SS type A sorting domain-containing protein [Flavobacteriales bacterium]